MPDLPLSLAALACFYGMVREPFSGMRDPLLRLLNDPLFWGPLGAVLGIYLFFRGFLLLKRKRLVLDTPRSTVRAAALGPVELSGPGERSLYLDFSGLKKRLLLLPPGNHPREG